MFWNKTDNVGLNGAMIVSRRNSGRESKRFRLDTIIAPFSPRSGLANPLFVLLTFLAVSYGDEPTTLKVTRIGSTLAANFAGDYTSGGNGYFINAASRVIFIGATSGSTDMWLRIADSSGGTVRGSAPFTGSFNSYIVTPSGGTVIGYIEGPYNTFSLSGVDNADVVAALSESTQVLGGLIFGAVAALLSSFAIDRVFRRG